MKKSVLLLVQNLPVPQDRRVWMEARTLKENGFSVSVISPRKKEQKKREEIDGISVYRYLQAPHPKGYLGYFWEYIYSYLMTFYLVCRVYLKRGFSVIHTANPPDFFFSIALIFKLFGVKFIYDQHDLMPEMMLCKFKKDKTSFFYRILLFLEKMSYKVCDIHISTCQSGQEKTLSRVKNEPKNFIVRTVPDMRQINTALIDKSKVEELRKKFSCIGVYLGVMGPQDGVDKLLRSIQIIVHEFRRKDIGFILMGDGDYYDQLVQMSRDLEIENNVIFTGWADREVISTSLYSADIGLMPEPKNDYTDNSLHNKVLEYMLAGLPIVSFDLKEARVSAEESAVYAKGNNEREFAKAVIFLLDNPELRKKMGELGKERVQEKFDILSFKEALLKAYDIFFPETDI